MFTPFFVCVVVLFFLVPPPSLHPDTHGCIYILFSNMSANICTHTHRLPIALCNCLSHPTRPTTHGPLVQLSNYIHSHLKGWGVGEGRHPPPRINTLSTGLTHSFLQKSPTESMMSSLPLPHSLPPHHLVLCPASLSISTHKL